MGPPCHEDSPRGTAGGCSSSDSTLRPSFLQPGLPLVADRYAAACASAGIVLSRLGKFKLAEKYFQDGLKVYYEHLPLSHNVSRSLEYYTSTLHQQGKTEEAILALTDYEHRIQDLPNSSLALIKTWRRAATLHFTQNEWTLAESLLLKAEELEKKEKLPVDLQSLCDLAAVYWEMGDETRARAKEEELKAQKVTAMNMQVLPTTRSDLVSTLDCSILQGVYKLEMRINRTKPSRKEGDPLEEPADIPRKLQSCFLEATFQNTDPVEPPVTLTKEISSFSIELESPKLKEAEVDKWYEVRVMIYADSTKEKKLGQHHQLVYALNPQFTGFGPGL